MEQTPVTIVTEVDENKLSELRTYLKEIGDDLEHNPIIHFSDLTNLHYCCFIIIEDEEPPAGSEKSPPLLIFEANIDGGIDEFIQLLCTSKADFMSKIYNCCKGSPTSLTELPAFLRKHDYGANAFYIAHPGQTRDMIEREKNLRIAIEDFINHHRPHLIGLDPKQIKAEISGYLQSAGLMPEPPAPPSFWVKNGPVLFKVLLGAVAFTLLFGSLGWLGDIVEVLTKAVLVLIVLYLGWLLWRESNDLQDERMQWDSAYIKAIQEIETRVPQTQNHLSSIIYVKPGKLRLLTLSLVLAAINLLAKLVSTQGSLSGIVTIHFARWVILPGKGKQRNRLLFFSNYDGSWQNYLGEFIDLASLGLSAVWSNTEFSTARGFPKTLLLGFIKAGARDEQRFKTFARNSQRPELIWYCPYPDLSVKNIGNNQKIHDGLFSDQDIAAWLKLL